MLISGVPLISSEYVAVRVIDHTQAGFAEYDNVTSGTAANVISPSGLNIEAQKATRVTQEYAFLRATFDIYNIYKGN